MHHSLVKFKPPAVKNMAVTSKTPEVDSQQWYSEYGDENNKHIVYHKGMI